ncbi:WD40 repeat-like protein [Calocera viscosa TUFC12733]|uniref:Pre-rRNA-processing protein IPI3 n=1 Tax=Calocera viscosa (strain TUFC12733) TaxID=1330018 RepID=A0A167SAB6_CALVF|nr:WD40 repeat-like protein [Calocera viscosa TUFC12733]
MSIPQEVLLCALGPSAPGGSGGIYMHDLQTGTVLASFKQTAAGPHCTAVVPSAEGQGGVLLAAQPDKALMNAYSFQKDQVMQRIALPEKLSCLVIDRQGRFCAGGTSQGRLYIWEVASGILFASFEAHYRAVTVARFSDDGLALATASEDSGVAIWLISSLLDEENQNRLPAAWWMPTDHTLAVTDLQFGMGAFPSCRLFSVSLDMTCKVWDPSTKSLLTTFVFPAPLSLLAVERTERTLFVASAEGEIFQMNMFRQKRGAFAGTMQAVGGGGGSEAVRLGEEGEEKRHIKTEQPLKSLAISLTSSLLLAGTSDGQILLYDLASHQLLRSIGAHKGYSINALLTLLRPADLVGHSQLGFGSREEQVPVRPVAAFQRTRDQKARERHEVPMMLFALDEPEQPLPSISDQVLQHHAHFLTSFPASTDSSLPSLQTRVTDLEAEISRLRSQLGRAKGVNDAMWETVVRSVLTGPSANGGSGVNGDAPAGQVDGEQGSRKRQRTAAV